MNGTIVPQPMSSCLRFALLVARQPRGHFFFPAQPGALFGKLSTVVGPGSN